MTMVQEQMIPNLGRMQVLLAVVFLITSRGNASLFFANALALPVDPASSSSPSSPCSNTDGTSHTSTFAVTPCTRICRYNSDFYNGQVCIGCFRETYEIATWSSMTDMDRSYALMDAMDRWDHANANDKVFGGSITKNELQKQANAWQERAKQQHHQQQQQQQHQQQQQQQQQKQQQEEIK